VDEVLHEPTWHVEDRFDGKGTDVVFNICFAVKMSDSDAR